MPEYLKNRTVRVYFVKGDMRLDQCSFIWLLHGRMLPFTQLRPIFSHDMTRVCVICARFARACVRLRVCECACVHAGVHPEYLHVLLSVLILTYEDRPSILLPTSALPPRHCRVKLLAAYTSLSTSKHSAIESSSLHDHSLS